MDNPLLRFICTDGTSIDIPIKRFTTIKKIPGKVLFHFDEYPDEDNLLIVSEKVLPRDKKLDKILVIRNKGD